jgi:hypothetical protein
MIIRYLILFLFGVGLVMACSQKTAHPYASEKPNQTPLLFRTKGIENIHVSNITFIPDGKEFYFVTDSGGMEIIKYSRFINGEWSEANTAHFSGKYRMETPRITPDGKKFFFCRPSNNSGSCDIYVMNISDSGWSKPQLLDSTINNHTFNTSPGCDLNGNLFFCSNRTTGWKAFYSEYKNGGYADPILLDTTINRYSITELYIAPDQSYLLLGRFVSEKNWRDLYVSLRVNNSWSPAISLGDKINSEDYEGRPCISPDGNYLFYSKGSPSKIYQVEWKPILDSLKIVLLKKK